MESLRVLAGNRLAADSRGGGGKPIPRPALKARCISRTIVALASSGGEEIEEVGDEIGTDSDMPVRLASPSVPLTLPRRSRTPSHGLNRDNRLGGAGETESAWKELSCMVDGVSPAEAVGTSVEAV